jgi:hypothetical protein
MTTQPTVQEMLTLANLQMAAEATLVGTTGQPLSEQALVEALEKGNDRASRFTSTQAADFANTWEVVEQRSTQTGSSGTVFKNRQTGELVLSLRSTEFIDDFARDNKATNELEISQHGFAFGQLRDMERWFADLNAPGGALAGRSFSVTGYSLGGHLASAFNLMHGSETLANGQPRVERVVTFNGAGIGGLGQGTTLSSLLVEFNRLSLNADGQAFRFANATLDAVYQRAHLVVKGSGEIDAGDRQELLRIGQATAESDASIDPQTKAQAQVILDALARVDAIRAQAAWVPTLSSGSVACDERRHSFASNSAWMGAA